MIDIGKKNLLGVLVDAVDYDAAVARTMDAARERRPYRVSALAVHGVMTGADSAEHRYRLNQFDLLTPDGQPVKWALNWLYHAGLAERVYGPTLMLRLCEAAANEGISVYFYGSRDDVLERLIERLRQKYPALTVAGSAPSIFRNAKADERHEIITRIRDSGAGITFVGLGCPRQEVFTYYCAGELSMPVLAVGAAFDYHSGFAVEPPAWVQEHGLQWVDRLVQDPRRLWRRYLILNPRYIGGLLWQRVTGRSPDVEGRHSELAGVPA